jgi:DNA-binding NarL/FixJ family response regulator
LTAREREALALMVEDLNNREIAERLVVSQSTAKFHVSGILSKLGVESRTEAVALPYNTAWSPDQAQDSSVSQPKASPDA